MFASYGCFWVGWGILEYSAHYDSDLFPLAMTGKTLW